MSIGTYRNDDQSDLDLLRKRSLTAFITQKATYPSRRTRPRLAVERRMRHEGLLVLQERATLGLPLFGSSETTL